MSLFNIANELLGEVEKMKISAIHPTSGAVEETFDAQFNPEKYDETLDICYTKKDATGTKACLEFKGIEPQTTSIEFLFDASSTSLLGSENLGEVFGKEGLDTRLNEFKEYFGLTVGKIHQPYIFQAIWGRRTIFGYITKLVYKHQLFNKSGYPIRTLVNVTVNEALPEEEKKNGNESPDLTKIHTVVAGETLNLIAQAEYDDPSYYLEIARVNNLNNFRALQPGMELILPPIEKTA